VGPEQDRYQAAQAAPGAPAPVAVAPAAAPVAEVPAAPAVAQVKATVMAGDLASIDTLPRRIPAPVLRPQLSLCAPTGVEIGEGSRIVIMPDGGGVAERLEKRLAKAGATVLNLTPGVPTDELLTTLDGWMGEGPIQGVYWLSALDDEGPLDQLDLAGWREALRLRVKMLYATMRKLYEMSPFLVSGTRLGGYHGYNPDGATSPMGGSVVGFTKSYKKEKPDVLVKAVDFPAAGRRRKTAGRRRHVPPARPDAETGPDRPRPHHVHPRTRTR